MKRKDINALTEKLAIDVKRLVKEHIQNENVQRNVYQKIMEYKIASIKDTQKKQEVLQEDIDSAEFEYYYTNWIKNTILSSNINKILEDENFKHIIEMDKRAIPFIYDIIKEMPSFIVFSLETIYGYTLDKDGLCTLDELCDLWVKEIEKMNYEK